MDDKIAQSFDGVRKLVVEAAARQAFNKLEKAERNAIRIAYSSIAAWYLEKVKPNFGEPAKG